MLFLQQFNFLERTGAILKESQTCLALMSANILLYVEEISRVQASRRILEDDQNLRSIELVGRFTVGHRDKVCKQETFLPKLKEEKYQRAGVCTDILHNSSPCRQL